MANYWKPISSNYGDCQNTHWRFRNGNMACLACGVFDWRKRKWTDGDFSERYHAARKLIDKMPRQKSVVANLSKEDLQRILDNG